MKELKGYNDAKIITGGAKLPLGGYVCKIMEAKVETSEKGTEYLKISFDIAEGEFKGFYTEDYKNATSDNKKWRGTINVFIPDENSQYYTDNLSRFKTMMSEIEDSNNGYSWDWDEKKLKGKLCGIVYGEEEFRSSQDFNVHIAIKPRYITSVEVIRSEKFKTPKIKKLKGSNNEQAQTDMLDDVLNNPFAVNTDEELPF